MIEAVALRWLDQYSKHLLRELFMDLPGAPDGAGPGPSQLPFLSCIGRIRRFAAAASQIDRSCLVSCSSDPLCVTVAASLASWLTASLPQMSEWARIQRNSMSTPRSVRFWRFPSPWTQLVIISLTVGILRRKGNHPVILPTRIHPLIGDDKDDNDDNDVMT